MTRILGTLRAFGMGVALLILAAPVYAAPEISKIEERVLGNPKAPITVEEYVSLTCSHCAVFYNDMLPELEKRYVETGKVKFILRDFPLDGKALQAASLAHCMPKDAYYPFVKILYKNQQTWAFGEGDMSKILTQYAMLGGLSEERAKACLQDTQMQDAIIAERATATEKYTIGATPTFVINNGAEKLVGAQSLEAFTSLLDRLIAAKH